jgi:SAM-dependent methyltransferase
MMASVPSLPTGVVNLDESKVERVMKNHDVKCLSEPIEASVKSRGASLEAVWLDRTSALEKGVRRCDAIFRMMEPKSSSTILDLGCGPGLALGYLEGRYGPMAERYLGVDISEPLIAAARLAWSHHKFEVRDIIADPLPSSSCDYTAINGVLTAKYKLPHDAMESFTTDFLIAAWQSTSVAMSFNVMSIHVDWMRDDLFHWPMDKAVGFCASKLSRHVNIIADYDLYEYTVQVFREPYLQGRTPDAWRQTEEH